MMLRVSGSLLMLFAALLLPLLLTACATPPDRTGGYDAGVQVYTHNAPVMQWQSYAPSPMFGIHEWIDGEYEYLIERLPAVSEQFRSGYAVVGDRGLVFIDLGNQQQYVFDGARFAPRKGPPHTNSTFKSLTHEFLVYNRQSALSACLLLGSRSCVSISIRKDSYPFVFAMADDGVLTVTNYGEALLFADGKWCRMTMEDDVYSCKEPQPRQLTEPRRIQFYSSVVYDGRTLVGEWPTGRLYEFDGRELRPSEITPPPIAAVADQRLGYEAQSMAVYCGDLFVGYWPKGEIYRYDDDTRQWERFFRAFSETAGESFIPFLDRSSDGLDAAFFGQRISALVPYSDSLYVTTSNLSGWSSAQVASALPEERIAEYGAVYKINRFGCRTSYGRIK